MEFGEQKFAFTDATPLVIVEQDMRVGQNQFRTIAEAAKSPLMIGKISCYNAENRKGLRKTGGSEILELEDFIRLVVADECKKRMVGLGGPRLA